MSLQRPVAKKALVETSVVKHVKNSALYKEINARFAKEEDASKNAWKDAFDRLHAQLNNQDYSIKEFHENFKNFLFDQSKYAEVGKIDILFASPNDDDVESAIQKCFSYESKKIQFGLPLKDRKVRAIYEYGRLLLALASQYDETVMVAQLNSQVAMNTRHVQALQASDTRGQLDFENEQAIKRYIAEETTKHAQSIEDEKSRSITAKGLLLNLKLNPEIKGNVFVSKNNELGVYEKQSRDIAAALEQLKKDCNDEKIDMSQVRTAYNRLETQYNALRESVSQLKATLSDEELIKSGLVNRDEVSGEESVYFTAMTIDRKVAALNRKKEDLAANLEKLKRQYAEAKKDLVELQGNGTLDKNKTFLQSLAHIQKLKAKYQSIISMVTLASSNQSKNPWSEWHNISKVIPNQAWHDEKQLPINQMREQQEVSQKDIEKWVNVEFPAMVNAYNAEIAIVDACTRQCEDERNKKIPTSLILAKTDTIKLARDRCDALLKVTEPGVSATSKLFQDVTKKIDERGVKETHQAEKEVAVVQQAMTAQAADVEALVERRQLAMQLDPKSPPPQIVIPPLDNYIQQKSLWDRVPLVAKVALFFTVIGLPILAAISYFSSPEKTIASPKSAPLPARDSGRGEGPASEDDQPVKGRRRNSEPSFSDAVINRETGATFAGAERGRTIRANEEAAKILVITKLEALGFSVKRNNGSRVAPSATNKEIQWKDVNGKLQLAQPAIGLEIDALAGKISISQRVFSFGQKRNGGADCRPVAEITGQLGVDVSILKAKIEFDSLIRAKVKELNSDSSSDSVVPARTLRAQP